MTTPYIHPEGLTPAVLPYLETIPENYRSRTLDLFCEAVKSRTESGQIGANVPALLRWFRQSVILHRSRAVVDNDREAATAYSAMELLAGCYKEAGKMIAHWASVKMYNEGRGTN